MKHNAEANDTDISLKNFEQFEELIEKLKLIDKNKPNDK